MTAPGARLTIVIPAWNESLRIGSTLDHLIERCEGLDIAEVIVVNDGSEDDTAGLVRARAARAAHPRIRLVDHDRNRGKGAALRTGLAAASSPLVGFLDADLSVGPESFAEAARRIEAGADVVVGIRISHTGRADGAGQPLLRGWLSRLFKRFQRGLVGLPLQDTQCPFKLFNREAVARALPRCTSDGWGFDVEVLLVAQRAGLRIEEIPVPWHFVGGSTVRANPITAWRTLREVLAIRRRHGSA
ncbi:MAG: glycosyltransferase [Dehalococcoidia bacterium]